MNSELRPHFEAYDLNHFTIETLVVESAVLCGNPWNDPTVRRIPVLKPKAPPSKDGYPVVLFLAGFTGNGPQQFNLRTFEASAPQVIDRQVGEGRAPEAVYVFVDAMTTWGGSQFINSAGMGRYADFILEELIPSLHSHLPVSAASGRWSIVGGSSGGYGALHLGSLRPDLFGYVAAIAPDCFFEASLLPDIYDAIPTLQKLGGLNGVRDELVQGRFMKRRESHTVLNAIGMGLCYAPTEDGLGVEWPVDLETGIKNADVWAVWLRNDPLHFLPERIANVRLLKGIRLDVGSRDQFRLHFGTRQIRDLLKQAGAAVEYSEFDGTHFDLSERRPLVWEWLNKQWSTSERHS